MSKKALIVVDFQNDFVNPTGSLYVPGAEKIYLPLLKLIQEQKKDGSLIIATKDWHPINHCSFEIWPIHCLANTNGSELYQLSENSFDKIILKGTTLNSDSYSAFFDDDQTSNGLIEYLNHHNVNEVIIVGVALDFCVSATLIDAIKNGFHGFVNLNYTVGLSNKIIF